MSTLLRFLIGALYFVYMQAALLVPIIVIAKDRSSSWATPLVAAGVVFIGLGALSVGVTVSYHRWSDADARRRVHLRFAVMGALQGIGAVLLTVVGIGDPVLGWPLAVVVLVGLALDPVVIALGRAARSRDHVPVAGDDWVDTTNVLVRRGYRNAGLGAAIAFAAGVVLAALLAALLRERHPVDPWALLDLLAFACLGGMAGTLVSTLRIAAAMRAVVGAEFGLGRRIGRVVLRARPEPLSEDEERVAARYAAIASQFFPFQAMQYGLLYAGFVLIQTSSLLSDDDPGPQPLILIALFVGLFVALVPFQLSRARRARRYAVAHGTLAA